MTGKEDAAMAKILMADDAAFMRKVIKDTLSKNGFTDLYEAVDGADAVAKFDEVQPDLVILDITMPNMDGLEALKAIKANNEVNDIVRAIGDYRKLDNPTITGYEFSVITLVSMVCPKYLIVDKLRETLEELKTREPDDKPNFKIKVLLAGSENDDPDFIKLIEGCGALVVADRHCYGSLESRQHIDIKEGDELSQDITC